MNKNGSMIYKDRCSSHSPKDLIYEWIRYVRPDLYKVLTERCTFVESSDIPMLEMSEGISGEWIVKWGTDGFKKTNVDKLVFLLVLLGEAILRNHVTRCGSIVLNTTELLEVTKKVVDVNRISEEFEIPLWSMGVPPELLLKDLPKEMGLKDKIFEEALKELGPKPNQDRSESDQPSDEDEDLSDSKEMEDPNLRESDSQSQVEGEEDSQYGEESNTEHKSLNAIEHLKDIFETREQVEYIRSLLFEEEEKEDIASTVKTQKSMVDDLMSVFRGILRSENRKVSIMELNKRHPWLPGSKRTHRKPKLLAAIDISASMPVEKCITGYKIIKSFVKKADIDVSFWNLVAREPLKYNRCPQIFKTYSGTDLSCLLESRFLKNYNGVILISDGGFPDPPDELWKRCPPMIYLEVDLDRKTKALNKQRRDLNKRVLKKVKLADLIGY